MTAAERRALELASEWIIVGSTDRYGIRYATAKNLAERGLVTMIVDKHVTRLAGGWGAASYATHMDDHVWKIRITDDGLNALV